MAKIPAPTDFQVDDLVRVKGLARYSRQGLAPLAYTEGTVRAVYLDVKVCAVSFDGQVVHVPMSLLENRETGRHEAMSQVEMPEKAEPLVDRHGQWTRDLSEAYARQAEEASLDQWKAAIKPAGNPIAEKKASANSVLDSMLTDALHPAPRSTTVRVTMPRQAEFAIYQDLDWNVFEFNKADITIEEI